MQTGRLCLAASGAVPKAILPTVGGPGLAKMPIAFSWLSVLEFNNDLNHRLQVRR
jgi:hypothetical protein